jgi:thioredoxin-like negative regulator of GroEL
MAVSKSWFLALAVASAVMLPQVATADDAAAYQAIKNHDWTTAEQQLKADLQQEPGNLSRQLNLAWVYAQTGRKDEAAALYRDILRRDRDRVASLSGHDGTPIGPLAQRGLEMLNRQ